ncbi:MAG: M48 family peptidase, partial [Gammaproteobacteria bacterium]
MKAVVTSSAGALALLVLAACATSPTGRTQLMVFPESSAIAASRTAYSEMLTPLAEENKLDTDPALKRRVDGIVERIKVQAIAMRPDTRDWNWEMTVIEDPKTVNAWAMAGGKMA